MKDDINVIVSLGPSVYDSEQSKMYKYATIGVKWNPEAPNCGPSCHGLCGCLHERRAGFKDGIFGN